MKNDLTRFLLKTLLFIVLLFGADRLVGLGFDTIREKSVERNPMSETCKPTYLVEKVDADIIIIGASDANHHYDSKMIADSLGVTVFNGGIDGFGFMSPCCLINLILDRYKPKMIIWEIWESGICGDEFDAMNKLYPWADSESFKPYYNELKFQDKAFLLSKSYAYNSRMIDCAKPFFGGIDQSYGYRPLPSEGYKYPEKISIDREFFINPIKEQLFANTIKRIRESGVKLVICSAPQFRSDHLEQSVGYIRMKEIAKENNVPFLDYLYCEPYSSTKELYKDATHLNAKGAEIYTKQIIKDLMASLQTDCSIQN